MMLDEWTDEKNFQLHNLKFQIRQAHIVGKDTEARTLLDEFERLDDTDSPINRQFTLLYRTLIDQPKYTVQERRTRLESAICLTCPHYTEGKLPRVLAYEEIILINNIAICYAEKGERPYAIDLLYQLKAFYERRVVNMEEALRTELLIFYNLSKMLGLEHRYEECIAVCDLGIRIAKETGRCTKLDKILYNRAWAMVKRGNACDQTEAMQSAMQAFQLANILGRTELAQHIHAFIEENFGTEEL